MNTDETALPPTPPGIFLKNLLIKMQNAIKPKIGNPPGNFVLKALTTPRDFGENLSYAGPLDFQPVCLHALGQNCLTCTFSKNS
jgi:hypothetical protein